MTREEAIKELTQLLHEDFLSDYSEAIKMGIEVLDQEPCGDCISREAVMHILDEVGGDFDSPRETVVPIDYIADMVSELPPVTPQPNKWIPCSERLPRASEIVLLSLPEHTMVDGEECFPCVICGHYIGGKSEEWGISDGTSVGYGLVAYKHCKPIAWMPLPTPPNKSEIPTGQIVANGELYPGEFDDPLAEEGSDKE